MIKNFTGLSEIEILGQKYIVEQFIKSGILSDVYFVKQQGTELEYILKMFSLKKKTIEEGTVLIENKYNRHGVFKNAFEQEIKITKKVSDNFYKIFGNKESYVIFDFVEEDKAILLLKYFRMNTLEEYVESCKGSKKKYEKENIILLLTRSVYRLHIYGILHGDISPDNILIDDDGSKIVLIDYGNTFTEHNPPLFYKTFYSAPELFEKYCCLGKYTDIYSLGMTIRYILTGLHPEKCWSPMNDVNVKSVYYRWLLKNCLQRQPKKRFQSCTVIYITLCIYKYRKKIFMVGIVLLIVLVLLASYFFDIKKRGQKFQSGKSIIYSEGTIFYTEDNQLGYEIVDNKAYIISSSASTTNIVIPKEIDGIPVVAIQGININVTSVVISDGLERIDDYAFRNCQYLQRIEIPESVNYISEYAFINCGQLKEFDISLKNKFYELSNNKLIQKSDSKIIYEIQ